MRDAVMSFRTAPSPDRDELEPFEGLRIPHIYIKPKVKGLGFVALLLAMLSPPVPTRFFLLHQTKAPHSPRPAKKHPRETSNPT